MLMKKVTLIATMLLGLAAVPANAATYNWSFVCEAENCSGSGSLETNVAIGPALVTSISGVFGGSAITTLLGLDEFGSNDNTLFSLTQPELDFGGISFATLSNWVNLYYNAGLDSDYSIMAPIGEGDRIAIAGEFSVSPSAVPIPAALPLFAAGLGAMGFMGWRRKRKALTI